MASIDRQKAAGVAFIAAVVIVSGGLAWWLGGSWQSGLLAAYVAYGVVAASASLYLIRQQVGESILLKLGELMERGAKQSSFERRMLSVRGWLAIGGDVIMLAISWPIMIIGELMLRLSGIYKDAKSGMTVMARAHGRAGLHFASLYALVATAVFYGLAALGLPARDLNVICYLVLASLAVRQIAYVVHIDLPQRVRRTTRNPYLIIPVIAALDLLTLVACFAILYRRVDADLVSLAHLKSIATGILEYKKAFEGIPSGSFSFERPLALAMGALFGTSLVGVLWRYKEFQRTDEDHVALANISVMGGDYGAAIEHLDRVVTADEQAHVAEMIALVGLGDIPRAERAAAAFQQQTGLWVGPHRLWSTGLYGLVPLPDMPDAGMAAVIDRAFALRVPDVDVVRVMVLCQGAQRREWPRLFLPYIRPGTLVRPLCESFLALSSGDFATAGPCLDEAMRRLDPRVPTSSGELIWATVLRVFHLLADPGISREETHHEIARLGQLSGRGLVAAADRRQSLLDVVTCIDGLATLGQLFMVAGVAQPPALREAARRLEREGAEGLRRSKVLRQTVLAMLKTISGEIKL